MIPKVEYGHHTSTLTETDIARLEQELLHMLSSEVQSVTILKNIFEKEDYVYFVRVTYSTKHTGRKEMVRERLCYSNSLKETDRFMAELLTSIENSIARVKKVYERYSI